MKIQRRFTKEGISAFDMLKYSKRTSVLRNPDGSLVFEMKDIEVPEQWSQVATDILAQKYFRKTGVPLFDKNGKPLLNKDGSQKTGAEHSLKQVAHRLAGTWRHWGEKYKYFSSKEDAVNFYEEICYMLTNQMVAPNSPQWFNTGLNWAYNITGKKQGHFYVDPDTQKMKESTDAYSRPQPHACFIQSIEDNLVNEGGIFDLATREARIFKYGSGTGTNFSTLRGEGEHLSGGGYSSGLMSFLKIFDRAAGAIKSGGTTRRAAKMVIIDVDHPDVEKFIEWKIKEEEKVAALVAGSRINSTFLNAIAEAAVKNGCDRQSNPELNSLIKKALHRGIPLNYIMRILSLVEQGETKFDIDVFSTYYEDEAYITVSGQNSNNTVRVTNEYMDAVENDEIWDLHWRINHRVSKQVKATDLWKQICVAAWKCADPGLQYDTTINEWHTCPNSGRINASNPCSEYMFLDDTACNLASLNLMKFYDEETNTFKLEDFHHAVRLWTIVLEISVLMAQFPSKNMAQNSYDFRTLGLGYANLGSLLMVSGIPYDSPEALAVTGAITSIMTGESYATSAEMAGELGPFKKYKFNQKSMLNVIKNHRRAAYNAPANEYEGLTIKPMGINPNFCPEYLVDDSKNTWDKALDLGEEFGYRNAQVTVLAPTGTIGLVMDCDTTGIEPDFAVVKFKKLAGGGYFKIVNQSVHKALFKLGYTAEQVEEIERYSKGSGSLNDCPHINRNSLKEKGFADDKIDIIEKQLSTVFDIRFAFNKWVLGEDYCVSLGMDADKMNDISFDMLAELGFTREQIEEANNFVCGTMMIEGAPHLKEEHLPVFDTANRCGKNGQRFIPYIAHVKIMAAAQPFISGAISKTVNMPNESTIKEIENVYIQSWKMMLKAIAIYRDGSKLSQPLTSSHDQDLNEIVALGDEDSLDETKGPKELQEAIAQNMYPEPLRRRLPKKRHGFVREAYVGAHKVYLRTGEYEDGSLGEIFIDMYKEGASFRGLLNSFAILVSKALQYGIPLEELVDTFSFTRFEPSGIVQGHDAIKFSTSILDYVFRSLGYDYLNRTDFVHNSAVDEMHTNGNGKSDSHSNTSANANEESDKDSELVEVEEEAPPLATISKETNGNGNSLKHSTSAHAKQIGYTGEQCQHCGSIRVKRSGSCTVCEDCGGTSGCS